MLKYKYRKEYFYPRPPRGGRPKAQDLKRAIELISIHALREEGDAQPSLRIFAGAYFYPRPPRGGRQTRRIQWPADLYISIHALREEGDGAGPRRTNLF